MSESKCCLCSCDFSINNFPRMMPSCEHSSCTNCLKNIILKNKNMFVVCGTCNNRQEIPEPDLQYFPKNIALIKVLKQKNDQIQPPRSRQKSKNKRQQFSSQKRKSSPKSNSKKRLQETYQMCEIHSKQKQIICINDYIKLCPMCAVFGQHKDHKLKAITEIQKYIQETSLQFYELKNKKIRVDGTIKNQAFKLELVQKINIRKAELTKKIKDQFTTIYEAVQHAEKKAYDDLLKKFKEIYDKINNLVKQQNQSQKEYNKWTNDFQTNLKKSLSQQSLQNRSKYFFNGPLDNISQGQTYLLSIQQSLGQKKAKLQSYPNSLVFQKSEFLIRDIYNHIVLKIQQSFFNSFQYINDRSRNNSAQKNNQNSSENQINENNYNKKPIKVQFSSSQSFLSPMNKKIQHPSSPKKKSIPKARVKSKPKPSTAKKQEKQEMQSTTQKIVQIFCSDQGLQTLDLSSFYLNDAEILQILYYVAQRKQIKCLKLSRNKLTNEGFHKCLDYLRNTTNWNISFNNLSEQSLSYLIKQRQKTPSLRVINISNNKVNERKAKSYINQLKKIGIIVTL